MNLGHLAHARGDLAGAAAAYERVLTDHPDLPDAMTSLGAVLGELGDLLQARGQLAGAEAAYRRVVALQPVTASAHMSLGVALQSQGRVEEAMAAFGEAMRLDPSHPHAPHAWLCDLAYREDVSSETALAEHKRWAAGVASTPATSYGNVRDPERRLRIGYVSGDLRQHPVGFFLAPVLESHDASEFEVFCYSNDARADSMTARIRAAVPYWRDISGRSDADVAEQIGEDGIDILIDLSGHTPGHRQTLFARRPAPVQATWLGYASTTGLAAIDYLIADPWTAPAGAEAWCSEALVRLPQGRFTYGPPSDAPTPGPPPSAASGFVTFGSFNNLAKLGPAVVRLWSEVLREVPGSRLVLKWAALGQPAVRARIESEFARADAPAGTLELRGYAPHAVMMAEYGDIDIALDPFPFGGGLTSCEALWMGVPVVTWPQDRMASRQTFGFLHSLGLEDLAADDAATYVAKAVALAADEPRRAALRQGLRARMAASPLGDARAFTPGLEAAYRAMWRRWCASEPPLTLDL